MSVAHELRHVFINERLFAYFLFTDIQVYEILYLK